MAWTANRGAFQESPFGLQVNGNLLHHAEHPALLAKEDDEDDYSRNGDDEEQLTQDEIDQLIKELGEN